jgi:hypothetical protein
MELSSRNKISLANDDFGLLLFSVAGNRLLDLVSRDGDWYLEELVSMTGNVMQFATFARTYWMVGMHVITCLFTLFYCRSN